MISGSKYSEIESPEQFLPLVQKVVILARRKGAQFADAVISVGREVAVDVEKSSIKTSEVSWGKSFSIRVFIDGGMGYVSTNGFMEHELEGLVDRAVELSRIATPDTDFVALPDPETAEKKPVVFDPQILTVGSHQVTEWASENIRQAQAVCKDVIVSGDIAFEASASVLASSTGIELTRKSTRIHTGYFCVIKNGQSVGSFAEHDSARFLSDFVPGGLGEKAARRALEYRNPRKIATGRTTIVLGPLAAIGLISALASAANAESIQRKRSLLADKLNKVIAPDLLTITDNGLIDRGLYSGAYDGEGAKRKVVTIIDRGRFVNMLHNSATANKAHVPNTGHGSRTGGISSSNLETALGELPAAKLISQVEDGIYLEMGGLDPDLVSGDISTSLDFAFKIEKGELAYPVANAMVAGNLMEVLRNIDAVSSDFRYEPGNPMPTIRIRDVQVSSSGD
ncbi:MAG: TldD/PmbA family protein [Phycisphaerae bacterium]